jgi:hypothetical protein
MKIIKGFQNMGTEVKLLFKQLDSLSALCAISSISPPPISYAVNKICRVDFPCACGKCVPFRRHFVPVGFVPQPEPTLHFAYIASIHLSSAQLRVNTHFHSASYIHSAFPKALFQRYPNGIFYFLRRVCPDKKLQINCNKKIKKA